MSWWDKAASVGRQFARKALVVIVLSTVSACTNQKQDPNKIFLEAIARLIEHGDLSDVEFSRSALPFAMGTPHESGATGSNDLFQMFVDKYTTARTVSSSFIHLTYHPGDRRYEGVSVVAQMTFTNLAPDICIPVAALLARLSVDAHIRNDGLAIRTGRIEVPVGPARTISVIIPSHSPKDRCFDTMSLMDTRAL